MAEEKPASKQDLIEAVKGLATTDNLNAFGGELKDNLRQVAGTMLGNLDTMNEQANTRLDSIERELKLINRHLRTLEKSWPNSRPE
jgi:hypothetical protein